MKTKHFIFLSMLVMLFAVSCKCHKNQDSNATGKTGDTYRLIVSFISKGAGIDTKSQDAIASYLKTFNTINKVDIKPEIVKWGKEGEMDYCFSLSELSKGKQKDFIKGFQNVTQSSDLILLLENQALLHKALTIKTESTDAGTYRLQISFISIGAGPDAKLIESVDNYITAYNSKNNVTLAVEKYPWGREGEQDYCLNLSEIASDSQTAFIQGIKDLVKDSKLVFIKENEICKHKK